MCARVKSPIHLSRQYFHTAMASSVTHSSHSLFPFLETLLHSTNPHRRRRIIVLQYQLHRNLPRIEASRRIIDFPQGGSVSLVDDPRNWRHKRRIAIEDYDDEDDDDEEEEDRSLDLLVRFVQNVFKKISRKARRAVRSALPLTISTKLVGFSVDGVIVLTFLWVLKAFLEVVCTLGGVVFVSILLVRSIFSGLSYFQGTHRYRMNEFADEHRAWTGAQPAS